MYMHTYQERRVGLIDYTYMAARGVLVWLLLINPAFVILGIAGGATVSFGAQYLMFQDKSNKDAQQDARMDAADARDKREEDDRIERRADIHRQLDQNSSDITDLKVAVGRLLGWGAGASGAILTLQVVGLLRKKDE